jgi:hypothetical protein
MLQNDIKISKEKEAESAAGSSKTLRLRIFIGCFLNLNQ